MKGVRDLGDGVFRISGAGQARLFPAYSYLLTDGETGVLVDPGPADAFPATLAFCRTILPPQRLSYLILTSETPDACSSLPLWPSCGFSGAVLMHWSAGLLARFGAEPTLRHLKNREERVSFGNGRSLRILNVPGLPTAGSAFCLDERTGSLFTGLALGSLGGGEGDEDEESPDRIEAFHRLMFPALGNRPDIREAFAGLGPLRVLPRNGPPVERHLAKAVSLFGSSVDACAEEVARRVGEIERSRPAAPEQPEPGDEREVEDLIRDIQRIKSENIELQKSIIQASDDHIKDPVTGYYNEVFFEEYLNDLFPSDGSAPRDSVLFIRLDGIRILNERYGTKAGDTALKGLGLELLDAKRPNAIFFRMSGPLFACYLQGEEKPRAVEYARELQKAVEESIRFVEKVTVSVAVVELAEISGAAAESGRPYSSLMKIAKERLRLLDKLGPASLCSESAVTLRSGHGTVLLIEASPFDADITRKVLEREGLEVHTVTKGSEALEQADLHRPDVIVSEIYISQMDGFQIRQRLRASQDLKNIPFILVSRDKGESALQRAFDLGILHFFKKPVQPAELTGVIKLLIGKASEEHRP